MSAVKPWIVYEVSDAGAWLEDRFATREEAEMRAEALRRGMAAMGDGRRYEVREVAA